MGLSAVLLSTIVNATPITINFDSAQADYVPTSGQQNLTDQFASQGILFWDVEHNMAASVGNCGPGSGPFHLYGAIGQGNSFSGCGDTTASIDFIFVDPYDSLNQAFTTAFSVNIGDSAPGLSTLLAYDVDGNVLAEVANTSSFEDLGVSGIGEISRINVTSVSDYTTWDDISFESVTAYSVPEPSVIALFGFAFLGLSFLRKRK